jgi:hypothetical protein
MAAPETMLASVLFTMTMRMVVVVIVAWVYLVLIVGILVSV